MNVLKGFPKSNKIELTRSSKLDRLNELSNKQSLNTKALIGFSGKGPLNVPIKIKDVQQLHAAFGFAQPNYYLVYETEQALLSADEIIVCRAGNETLAKAAEVPIPSTDSLTTSTARLKGPYVFDKNHFFRWRLNEVLSPKALVILATDENGIEAEDLANELNEQLTPRDGIRFYVHNNNYLVVRATRSSATKIELISVSHPWGSEDIHGIFYGSPNNNEVSITIQSDSPGRDGNSTKATIVHENDSNRFTINVHHNGLLVESWGQLTKQKNDKFYVESFVNLVSDWIRIIDNPKNSIMPKEGGYCLGDEKITGAVQGCDGVPDDQHETLLINSIETFRDRQLEFDMIAVPGHCSAPIVHKIGQLCDDRNDCLAIIDAPMEYSYQETHNWAKFFNYKNIAIYWPWLQISDSKNTVWVPPSGAVMSVFAKMVHPWYQATGIRAMIAGVLDIYDDSQDIAQVCTNINSIIRLANKDNFCLATQRTTSGKPINERRTMLYVEKILRSTINNLLMEYEQIDEKFTQLYETCDYILSLIESGRGISDYTIHLDEFAIEVGIQVREATEIQYIKISLKS